MSAPPPPNGPPQGGIPMPMPGQRPTPEQIAEIQRRVAEDAEKAGMTVPEFIEHIKKQAMEQQRMRMMQQQQAKAGEHVHGEHCNHDHGDGHHHHNHQQGQPQPIVPGPPNPKALALAKFLKGQDLKPRTSILNGERKDMFRGMSAVELHRTCQANLDFRSQASTASPTNPGVRKSTKEEPSPTRNHGPGIARECLQTPSIKHACSESQQD